MADLENAGSLENAAGVYVRIESLKRRLKQKETRENTAEFDDMRSQLANLEVDFENRVQGLMPQILFEVATLDQVHVLQEMKREGWRGKAQLAANVPRNLRDRLVELLVVLKIFKE